ncbi:MAG: hypothetical protein AMXMBFR33_18170 [Candidatus Xenobia bacterium]
MQLSALPCPASNLRQVAHDLCVPSPPPPPPGPSDELLAARAREPFLRAGRGLRNLAVGAGAVFLPGFAGKACGAVVGAMGAGVTIGGVAGVLVAIPCLLLAKQNRNWPVMMAIGVAVTGFVAGTIAGGYLGYQLGGEGLSLSSAALAASALLMNTQSSKLKRLEGEHAARVESNKALHSGEKAREDKPLEAPSAIERIGDLVLVGGIRLPQRRKVS